MLESLIPYLIWFVPAAPLAAAIATAAFGRGERAHWPCVGALGLSFLASVALLAHVWVKDPVAAAGWTWIDVGSIQVSTTLRVDAMTAMMLTTVTFVSTLVAIFSSSYMHGDRGYPRYFAEVALFVFAMCVLVLAGDLLVLFAGWEGVGLCSYLLIGFWYEKPSAAAAARKAFVVNRIGDLSMLIGLFLIWRTFGSLDFAVILDHEKIAQVAQTPYGPFSGHGALTAICLLLFGGAVGKSAQFPLHVWLPDAMEGPTPVSALIHAATMVTAGVYLVARCTPLFVEAPVAQVTVATIGGLTALLAALIALTQTDLKKVLAYSTVSQLGYMFLALGAGAAGHEAATFATIAALFHLVTHAFFKALLFLGAGSVMHAMNGETDIRKFGGLRKTIPWTHATFLIGTAALAGFPLLAGFWSKDEILVALRVASAEGPWATWFLVLFAVALATAVLTAFYSFRAYFLTFWGEERFSHAHVHPHESPPAMIGPLAILAALAAIAGLALGPTGLLANLLERTPGLHASHAHHVDWVAVGLGTLAALIGIGGAYAVYVASPGLSDRLARAGGPLYQLSLRKFYLDEVFQALLVLPLLLIGRALDLLDRRALDPAIDLGAGVPRAFGSYLRPAQNGLTGAYGFAMFTGVIVLFLASLAAVYGVVEKRPPVPVETTAAPIVGSELEGAGR